jgi:hypothetical protein
MANRGVGVATISFPASPQAAEYASATVVSDSAPNPSVNVGSWAKGADFNYTPIAANYVVALAYVNGKYVLVIAPGAYIYTSVDGVVWTKVTLSGGYNIRCIAYGGGVYVLQQDGSTTYTSTDLATWAQNVGVNSIHQAWGANGIAYGAGLFVGLGASTTNVTTSPDGVVWTVRTGVLPAAIVWARIFYVNGLFFAAANDNVSYIATSPDGLVWTQRTMPSGLAWGSVAYGNGKYVFNAHYGTATATSSNGFTWVAGGSCPSSEYIKSIAFGAGIFTLACNDMVFRSIDGAYWEPVDIPFKARDERFVTDLVWSGSQFLLMAGDAGGILPHFATSPNGVSGGAVILNTRTITTVNTESSPAKPSPGTNQAKVTVAGIAGVTANSSASAFLLGSDSTSDHNAYEHEIIDLELSCDNFVPGVGFDITATSTQRLEGDFKVRYAWGN